MPFDRAQSSAQRRPRSEEQFVIVATGKRSAHRVVALRAMVITHPVRERNRLPIDSNSNPRCRCDLTNPIGQPVAQVDTRACRAIAAAVGMELKDPNLLAGR